VAEAWRRDGDPTVAAQLAQVRALLSLHATERAWSRLLPLLESPSNAEIYHLAGRILQSQGRHATAIRLLRKGLERFPGHTDLTRQLHHCEQPNTVLDRTEPVHADSDAWLRIAEHHLDRAEPVRARQTLERVLAVDPENARATDLLWALDGDFVLRGIRLQDLTRIYAAPRRAADLAAFDADAEQERTETASTDHLALLDEPRISGGFPNLFKNLEPQTELQLVADEPEPTAFAHDRYHVDPDRLPDWATSEHRDTQIARVVRKPPPMGEDGIDTQIDAVDDPTDLGDLGAESEDEDVVVRRPAAPMDLHDQTETYRPLAVDPACERLPPGANTADEGADFVRPRPRRAVVVEEPEPTPPPQPIPEREAPVPRVPRQPAPARPELEPASLPPPIDTTGDYDLNSLYQQPTVSWTGWLLLGMLIGSTVLALALVLALAWAL
jgi:tetratricopeptide (TPR) repeat protein